MVEKFVGRDRWGEFLRVVERAHENDGTISPGGAAMLLGVSRQRIYTIVETNPDVRGWAFYERPSSRQAEIYEVCVRDLLRWAVKAGRVKSASDLTVQWVPVVRLLEEVLEDGLSAVTGPDTL